MISWHSPCFTPSVSSQSVSESPLHMPVISSTSVVSPLSTSISPSIFHCRLKTHLFHKSFPPWTLIFPQDWLHGLPPNHYFLLSYIRFCCSYFFCFWFHSLAYAGFSSAFSACEIFCIVLYHISTTVCLVSISHSLTACLLHIIQIKCSISLTVSVIWKCYQHETFHTFLCGHCGPLPSNRHHRRCGDCLEGKGENYQVCSVQYCVQQLCTMRCAHIWTD